MYCDFGPMCQTKCSPQFQVYVYWFIVLCLEMCAYRRLAKTFINHYLTNESFILNVVLVFYSLQTACSFKDSMYLKNGIK